MQPGKPKRAQNYRKATKTNYPERNKIKNQAHKTTDITTTARKRESREETIPQRAVPTHLLEELAGPLELVLRPELSVKDSLKLELEQESLQDLEEGEEPVPLLPSRKTKKKKNTRNEEDGFERKQNDNRSMPRTRVECTEKEHVYAFYMKYLHIINSSPGHLLPIQIDFE